ncbi:adenosine deaminase [Nocardia sp. GAS34]|uniref:adenosine deaminase family protein n=1 Tax=unclassified Nocardia TaxID=2637762 RepID=UPI003D1B2CF7
MALDLVALPKAELHIHLESAISRDLATDFADRYQLPTPPRGPFPNQAAFVRDYERVRDLIGSLADLHTVAKDLAERQRAIGVRWTEVHFIPATYGGRLGSADALVDTVVDGLRSGGGPDAAGIVLGINRGLSRTAAWQSLEFAKRWHGRGVVALGLAGDEAGHPAAGFEDLFAAAAEAGIPAVPHAGEGREPSWVAEGIDHLCPTRISHGLAAADDALTLARIKAMGICLDLAPSSNVLLGLAPSLPEHPLPQLFRAGIPVSLSTDIPYFLGYDLVEELRRCALAWDLSDDEIVRLSAAAWDYALCPAQVRSAALADMPQAP